MTVKQISNLVVATAVKTAFNDAFDAKTADAVKVTVTGTGTTRSANIRAGVDSFSGNLDIDANNVVSALLNGTKLSLNEWSRLAKKASTAALKAHDKIVNDFTNARKKADKKSAVAARDAQKKAAKKLADKQKEDAKKNKIKKVKFPTPASADKAAKKAQKQKTVTKSN